MVKRCAVCGIEIADTNVDTQGRYNAVSYCTECANVRHRASKQESQRRKRAREKAVRSLMKADILLKQQQEIQSMKIREKELLEEVARLKHEKTVEQEQADIIRKQQAEINERKTHSISDAVRFMRNRRSQTI